MSPAGLKDTVFVQPWCPSSCLSSLCACIQGRKQLAVYCTWESFALSMSKGELSIIRQKVGI